METRFAVIPDERRLLLGIDKEGIFEAGAVYKVTKILGQIIMKKIGRYSLPPKGHPSKFSEANAIIYYGSHLITKKEMKMIEMKSINKK